MKNQPIQKHDERWPLQLHSKEVQYVLYDAHIFDFFSSKVYITRSVLSFRKSRTTWRMMALLLVGFRLKLHANVLGIWPFRVYFVSNYRVWSWSCGSIILFYICHVVIFHTTDLFEVMSRDSSAKHLLCSLSQADNSVGRSAVRAKRACWSLWRTRQDSSYLRVVMSLQAPPSVVFRLLFFTFLWLVLSCIEAEFCK
jgi:hypothetical protein